MHPFTAFLSVVFVGLMPSMAQAAGAPASFTDAQKAEIEDVVRDFLTKKEPEIIVKAAQEVQHRQENDMASKSKQALAGSRDKIFNDPNSPTGGNPKGDVTVVEFYDYQCGYCKMAQEGIAKLLSADKNVKFIYKEFPVLGANSVQAAKASLASVRQNKFQKFHDALLTTKDHLSDEVLFKVAKDVGLDVEKLKKDMSDDAIDKMIKDNLELGNDIGARGTPTFVIGDRLYPGAMPYETMKQTVDELHKPVKK